MKKKILFILHMPPPVHGAAMMGKYMHDSRLLNDTFDCHYINLATAKNLEDIGKVGFSKIMHLGRLLVTVFKTVRQLRPSLVYVTPNAKGGAFLKDFVVITLLKLLRCTIVLHYHNKGVASVMHKPLYNILYKRFFKNVKVVLLGESLYADISKYVDRKNVLICPNGIPRTDSEGVHDMRSEVGVPACPHILFLSNLLLAKGVIDLLDACKLLKDKGIDFRCDIVGGETYDFSKDSFQQEIVNRQLGDRVIYHGRQYGEQKNRFFLRSSLFVLPTYNECFPLVLLEAMQHGLACIATDEGAIRDIIDLGKTGEIISKNDSQALAEKMESLLTDTVRCSEMGKAGYDKYNRMFTIDKFEQKMTNLFNQLLN